MADVRKAAPKNAAANTAADTLRKEAQVEWAMNELNRNDAPLFRLNKKGELEQMANDPDVPRVIIMPVFTLQGVGKNRKWMPSDDIARQGNNKAFASLLLMSFPNSSSGRERWQDKQWALANRNTNFLITALAPMPIEDVEKYTAGQLLVGRIDTAYTLTPTNPNNPDQDKWYLNADAREADIPVTDDAGNVYYQKRYYEDDLNYPVQPQPRINRAKLLEEIMAAKA